METPWVGVKKNKCGACRELRQEPACTGGLAFVAMHGVATPMVVASRHAGPWYADANNGSSKHAVAADWLWAARSTEITPTRPWPSVKCPAKARNW